MNLKPSTPPETHNAKNNYIQKSPTITMFSKNAMNEVYSMFNQSVGGNQKEQLLYPGYDTSVSTNMNGIEDNNTERRFEMYENFTQDLTRKTMDDLTEVKVIDPIIKKTTGSQDASKSLKQISKGSKLKTFMTPIDNKNILENFKGINDIENRKTPTAAAASSYATNIIEDPLNESFRKHLLNEAKLRNLPNFYQYEQDLKMSQVLKRIHSKSKKLANKNPIVNFQKTNELYCIRGELGKGGYAVVYLAESSNGSLKALKVQKPASEWEFYILKQIENRLSAKDFILNSIIYVDSLHCFRDESYLVLNYISQGTLLDLINIHKTERGESCLNELLCMFFTIELLKVLESLHDVGIIHGDLKPDNCMVRFIKVAGDILGDYNSNNQNGWQNKGIYLIDFGRSFDLSLFPMGTKFKANWKCDQQDCIEMRTGTPWSYEADYYGLAGIIHSMLFGEFIETIEIAGSQNNNTGFYKLKNGFKRYWQKQLWEPLFDLLLNSGKKELPRTSELMQCRQNMENFLTDKENGNKLKSIILGLEPDLVYKLKSN
ncbi:uncharacterized protein SCODWIG_00579 [Saccharomycodes ludwigii]|uniref:Protein kinase domain-containing protein n=1 Tax=Saccharomycodes ludwigii TaxID=36035 RepID=A0A376B2B3_9ASCO|nr:uncharacterized protein SCODWIG_00579 [Saccharomycodes ludwigii]